MNEEYEIQFVESKTGVPNLRVNKYLLHSMYNPLKEAESFVQRNYKKGYVHILFGYGCGYIVKEFLKKMSDDDQLIVIEPLLKNLDKIDGDYTLIHSDDIEYIKKRLISEIKIVNFHKVIPSINYDKIMPKEFLELLKFTKEQLFIKMTTENTINLRSYEWQRNYLLNLQYCIIDNSLIHLKNSFEYPVVIASGGPSLTKQIPILKINRDSFILISAGSTISTLMNEGIEPDYIISIDGNIANLQHFKDYTFEKAKLIYLLQSYPEIRKQFKSEGYFFLSLQEVAFKNHLSKIVKDDITMLPGGGSVANFALSIATYISKGPIALIGQDLAYTNNETHALNNKQHKKINVNQKIKEGAFYSEGYYDEKVLTDYVFMGMKRSFESLKSLYTDREIYNCTEGGIKLEGFKQMPFLNFIDENKSVIVNLTNTIKKFESKGTNEILINLMNSEKKIYKEIILKLTENIKLINNNRSNTFFANKTIKKLDQNDFHIQEMIKNTCLAPILDPINIEVLKNFKAKDNETLEEKYSRIKEQNITLYGKMVEAIKQTEGYINELLIRIEV